MLYFKLQYMCSSRRCYISSRSTCALVEDVIFQVAVHVLLSKMLYIKIIQSFLWSAHKNQKSKSEVRFSLNQTGSITLFFSADNSRNIIYLRAFQDLWWKKKNQKIFIIIITTGVIKPLPNITFLLAHLKHTTDFFLQFYFH